MLVCGCNGAGKSTLTYSSLEKKHIFLYIDPDRIAKEENKSPIEAGKEAIKRTKKNLAEKISFLKESTLSSQSDLKLIENAQKQGFYVEVKYISLANVNDAITRMQDRSQNGGHSVPIDDIKRRYERSMANLPQAITLADKITIYDNTRNDYREIATYEKGQLINKNFSPLWFKRIEKIYAQEVSKR